MALRALAFFLVFMAMTQVGYLFAFPPLVGIGVFWPSAGLCLAVLLLDDVRTWPAYVSAIFVGELVGVFAQGLPLPVCLAWAVAASGEPLLSASLLRRVRGAPFRLGSVKDLVALVGVGVVLSPCVGAAMAATAAVWWLDAPSWRTSWSAWWFGDALGVLVVAPVLLVWLGSGRTKIRPLEVLLGGLLLGAIALAAQALFGGRPMGTELRSIPGVLVFPLMLWAAVRYELRGATAAAAILNVLAAYHTTRGRGMFAELGGSPMDRLLALQAYLSSATFSSLALSAALAERRRGDQQRQDVIDNASAVIFAVRPDGRYLFVNRAFERIAGRPRKELVGMTARQLWPGRAQQAEDAYQEILRTGQARTTEDTIPTSAGPRIYVTVRFPLMGDQGRPYAVCGMSTDITERTRAEDALHRSEERLRLVVAATHDAIYDADMVTGKVWRNDRWRQSFGTAECLEGWRERIHPDDRPRVLGSLDAALEARASTWEAEYRFRRLDGSYAHVLDNACLRYGPGGRPQRVIGAIADVTERREAQLAVERANAELEQRVAQRTAELAVAFEHMESFGYSIAHDLRGPLRAINGFGKALEEELGSGLTPDAADYLSRIRVAASRMGDLIDDLLTLSRASRAEVRHEDVDLGQIVGVVAEELREAAPARVVTLSVEPDLIVCGDPGLLRIVMQNLLDNAWKFTSGHPAARIEVGRTRLEGETVYFVRDDGAGFDPSYARKLFRPFERLHRPAEFPGTGIGLATTHRIIGRHGGRVWATGAVERGATVYFTLPAPVTGACGPTIPTSISNP